MSESDTLMTVKVSVEDIQRGWHDLKVRVAQLEAEREAMEKENKELRSLLERTVEHRAKSHTDLINLLSGLVSKLPLNDAGVIITRLMEHNTHVGEVCAALAKGKIEATQIQPQMMRQLDEAKRNLKAAVAPLIEELIKLDSPIDHELLKSFAVNPELFFTPQANRANRGYVKGQVPRKRILREFGEASLAFFTDVTTDPKLNPRPNPDDIMLVINPALDALLAQNPSVVPDKHAGLRALNQRIQRSKATTDEARAQKQAFLRLSFVLELLHYYENQNTESPEVVFAQRMPPIIEQLVVSNPADNLNDKLVVLAESLLAHVINNDHRLSIINNIGKSGGAGRSLRFVLRLRNEKAPTDNPIVLTEVLPDFIKHLCTPTPQQPAQQQAVLEVLKFLIPDLQKLVLKALMNTDRLNKSEADTLTKMLSKELGLTSLEVATKAAATLTPEMERQLAWGKIKDMVTSRADPTAIAAAIRDRLHAKYESDEIKQSWVVLTEADPMSFIRTFCQLPYLSTGKTDSIAQPVLESYVVRLTHEKYAPTYNKVTTSLKNMFKAKPDSPTLVNFISLVRWVDAHAADKISADIGMTAVAR
ncbi:MAG: hypothetical protein RLY20_1609 [Verrucomicrobiota bacterium]|jgi:hypothetical protein